MWLLTLMLRVALWMPVASALIQGTFSRLGKPIVLSQLNNGLYLVSVRFSL